MNLIPWSMFNLRQRSLSSLFNFFFFGDGKATAQQQTYHQYPNVGRERCHGWRIFEWLVGTAKERKKGRLKVSTYRNETRRGQGEWFVGTDLESAMFALEPLSMDVSNVWELCGANIKSHRVLKSLAKWFMSIHSESPCQGAIGVLRGASITYLELY